MQIETPGAAGLICRRNDQVERGAEAAGRLQIAGRGDALCGRVAGLATGPKGVGGDPARREGCVPRTLELEEGGQLALSRRQLERLAALAVALSGFAPGSGCFAELTTQLGVLAQSVERGEPGRLVFSRRP